MTSSYRSPALLSRRTVPAELPVDLQPLRHAVRQGAGGFRRLASSSATHDRRPAEGRPRPGVRSRQAALRRCARCGPSVTFFFSASAPSDRPQILRGQAERPAAAESAAALAAAEPTATAAEPALTAAETALATTETALAAAQAAAEAAGDDRDDEVADRDRRG